MLIPNAIVNHINPVLERSHQTPLNPTHNFASSFSVPIFSFGWYFFNTLSL